jgi:hypothetical protein
MKLCCLQESEWNHQVKQNKPDAERQILNDFSHMWNIIFKNDMKIE